MGFSVGPSASGSSGTAWAAYTPSASQGFGTLGAVDLEYKETADGDLLIRGTVTAGTVTGDEARLELPAGYTTSASLPTLSVTGLWVKGSAAASTHGGAMLIEASKTYMVFGNSATFGSLSVAGLAKAVGSGTVVSSELFSIHCRIPVA